MAVGVLDAWFGSIGETSARFYAEYEATSASTSTRRIKLEYGTSRGSYTNEKTYSMVTGKDGVSCSINSGNGVKVSSLKAGTRYYFRATLGYLSSTGADVWLDFNPDNVVTDYFDTEEPQIIIDPWSWSLSNGVATVAQTQRAYQFIRGQISNSTSGYFSYKVWNDMVDKVAEVMTVTRGGWDSYYMSQSATKVSSGENLSARKFNSLRNNVDLLQASGVPYVSNGDPIYGEYFTKMMDAVNRRINNM